MTDTANRKRASSEQEDNTARKLPRNGGVTTVHLKLLIPSNMAGSVLGKGGETIIRIQEESSIKAHMSKSNEHFPGTSDRVCTLSGNDCENIKMGVNKICDKLFEKMDSLQEKLTLKILIPNPTAGMVIGKGGEHIRAIKESTGAFVQLSRKTDFPERCITITGNKDEISKAASELVDMIGKDPLSGSCLSVNYNSYAGDSMPATPSLSALRPPIIDFSSNVVDDYDPRTPDLNLTFNFTSAKASINPYPSTDMIDYIELLLRSGGFRPPIIGEITNAILILMRHGMLNNNVKRPIFGGFNNFSNGYPRLPREVEMNDGFTLQPSYGEDEQGKYTSLLVSDQKVGAIMGTRGATLTEIQQVSKARVRVSKKEDSGAGSKDRIVFIYGGKKETDVARSIIEWKLKEYDAKHTKR